MPKDALNFKVPPLPRCFSVTIYILRLREAMWKWSGPSHEHKTADRRAFYFNGVNPSASRNVGWKG